MSDVRKILIDFMENIRDYVRESGRNLAHDDRESEEFVDLFIEHNPGLFKPKRKPLPDGSLELTSEELCKFNQLMELTEIKKVFVKNGFIYYTFFDLDIILSDVKAILYLATLFDLTEETK